MPQGIDRRLCAVRQAEFAQDAGDMRLDRLFADQQACGDFGVGQSLRQQFQHFSLAFGERIAASHRLRLENALHERWFEDRFALRRASYRFEQLFQLAVLLYIGEGACAQCANDPHVVGVPAQDDDRCLRQETLQAAGDLDAVDPARHEDVHDDHIRLPGCCVAQRLFAAGGLPDDGDVGLSGKVGAQPAPDNAVVADQCDTDGVHKLLVCSDPWDVVTATGAAPLRPYAADGRLADSDIV